MTQADLQAIRNPSLLLALVLLAAAGAVYYTNQLVVGARQQLGRQETQMKEAITRLQRSGDEREIIVRHRDAYKELQRRGFVGEEQRINWLDGLRLTNQQADLFGVDYEIGVQGPYRFAADLNPGPVQLKASIMKLRFRLLHEEDLTRFLGILAGHGSGIYTVDQCSLKRITTIAATIRYQPNLSAECDLAWITAHVGDQPEQKKP